MMYKSLFIIFVVFFISCDSSIDKKNELKKLKLEKIQRKASSKYCDCNTFVKRSLNPYPFETNKIGNLNKITKEYFRCKGSSLNPERVDDFDSDDIKVYLDCEGGSKHSLPLINGKEGVYPVLLDVLNFIQRKTKKKVVITSAHRCPKHNTYADLKKEERISKHMIGAEVDFYVQGYENRTLDIIEIIKDYYLEKPKYNKEKDFIEFVRYDKSKNTSTEPWYNKEIFIKLYNPHEGRDFDNRHPYPYISIQVKWNREKNEKVIYSWEKANRGFLRY
ncbi:MAG: hypothetical protein K1060chlam5_00672 [Candidatus Anoxychlamydiales bacterium]|nr:hypothetical protein [Candidatus Anoxychlamydiales bacterium]